MKVLLDFFMVETKTRTLFTSFAHTGSGLVLGEVVGSLDVGGVDGSLVGKPVGFFDGLVVGVGSFDVEDKNDGIIVRDRADVFVE